MTQESGKSPNRQPMAAGSSHQASRDDEDDRTLPTPVEGWNPDDATIEPTSPRMLVPPPPDVPRRSLVGPYRIVRRIGQGGMGVVLEAIDPARGIRVALKMIRADLSGSLTRFLGEFHSLAQLTHEHLVRIYELALDGPEPFYTMEFVEGVDFLSWVRPSGPEGPRLDEARLRTALRQLASALIYVHSEGHLHRDLKPSNVLVTTSGDVKVLDFGLAARLAPGGIYENSAPGMLVGTLPYMPPEQAEGRDLTTAADWYSVGVMLFQSLTGELPHRARTPLELLARKREPVSVPSGWQGDTACMQLAVALLDPEPSRRPTGDDVIRTLGAGRGRAERVKFQAAHAGVAGREDILDALKAEFAAVENERTARIVLVQGASGMGKSELLRVFLEHLQVDHRALIFAGRCYESVLVPYKAVDGVNVEIARRLLSWPEERRRMVMPLDVDALCEVFRVFSEVYPEARGAPRGATPQDRRRQAFAAYRSLLARLTVGGPLKDAVPVVIFVDDLQWGDLDSVSLLIDVFRNQPPPILFVCAFRSEDRQSSPCVLAFESQLAELDARLPPATTCIEVGPLHDAAARDLARTLLRATGAPSELADAIARESEGNPLFLHELVRYVRRQAEACGPCVESALTERVTLDQVLASALEDLSPEERRLLTTVAAAGRPADRSLVYRAAGCQTQDPSLLLRLVDQRFVRTLGGEQYGAVDTYHDRIRAVAIRQLAPDERRNLHAAISRELEATGSADVEFLAQQHYAAGNLDRAGEYFRKAADEAARALAFDRAVRLYAAALDCRPDADQELEIRIEWATALAHAGRGRESAEQFLRVADSPRCRNPWQYRCQAALRFLTSGHMEEGRRVLRETLAAVGLSLPQTAMGSLLSLAWWRIRLVLRGLRFQARSVGAIPQREVQQLDVCWSAVAGLSVVDPLRAAGFVARHLHLALRAGEPRRLLRALAVHTSYIAMGGSRSRRATQHLLQRVREVAEQVSGNHAQAVAALAEGVAAHLEGQWRLAWERCDQAEQWLLDTDYPDIAWELDTVRTFACWARMYGGQAAELARRQPALRQNAIERDDLFGRWNFGARVMTTVCLLDDRVEVAKNALDEDEQLLSAGDFHVQHHNMLLARAMVALYEQNGLLAWRLVADAWKAYRHSLLSHVQQVRIDFLDWQGRAALAAAAEDPKRARELLNVAKRCARRLAAESVPWGHAVASMLRAGLLSFEFGDDRAGPEAVAAAFERASLEADHAGMELLSAAAQARAAQWRGEDPGQSSGYSRARRQGLVAVEKWLSVLAPARPLGVH